MLTFLAISNESEMQYGFSKLYALLSSLVMNVAMLQVGEPIEAMIGVSVRVGLCILGYQ